VKALEEHLKEMERRYRKVSSQEVGSRLSSELGRIADRLHRSSESGPLEIPLSRMEVAQLSGATLFTVSRLLTWWEAQGIATLGRREGREIVTPKK
jgi:CRP-like cAMP-binding protein